MELGHYDTLRCDKVYATLAVRLLSEVLLTAGVLTTGWGGILLCGNLRSGSQVPALPHDSRGLPKQTAPQRQAAGLGQLTSALLGMVKTTNPTALYKLWLGGSS
eukprot:1879136-Amphidinium_carterae.1